MGRLHARWMMVALLALGAHRAAAAPGDLVSPLAQPGIALRTVVDACAAKLQLCTHAGAATTLLPSPPIAADGGATSGTAPRYRRADTDRGEAWRVEVFGRLRRPSWAGNVIFVFFDLEDPTALGEHRYTALYQTNAPRLTQVAADLTLTPDEGFSAGHTYRVRVAQLISGKEVVLAETDVALD